MKAENSRLLVVFLASCVVSVATIITHEVRESRSRQNKDQNISDLKMEIKSLQKELANSNQAISNSLKYFDSHFNQSQPDSSIITSENNSSTSTGVSNEPSPIVAIGDAQMELEADVQMRKNSFSSEPINQEWASRMEHKIENAYNSILSQSNDSNQAPRFAITQIKCKTKSCKFQVTYNDVNPLVGMQDVRFLLLQASPDCGYTSLPYNKSEHLHEWYVDCN